MYIIVCIHAYIYFDDDEKTVEDVVTVEQALECAENVNEQYRVMLAQDIS